MAREGEGWRRDAATERVPVVRVWWWFGGRRSGECGGGNDRIRNSGETRGLGKEMGGRRERRRAVELAMGRGGAASAKGVRDAKGLRRRRGGSMVGRAADPVGAAVAQARGRERERG